MKTLKLSLLMIAYIVSSLILGIGPGGSHRSTRNGQKFCKRILRALGATITVRGTPGSGILVANHQSYLDILVLLSVLPCRFITFTEMTQVPGMGILTHVGQTLLVNRSKPSLIKRDIALFEKELKTGVPIVFFPEGSSFDGSCVQPFKSPLFESAIRTGVSVQPVCLRYTSLNGEPITAKNRHLVFYYGDMELIPQLMRVVKNKSVSIEVVFMPSIQPQGKTRKEISEIAHHSISGEHLAVL